MVAVSRRVFLSGCGVVGVGVVSNTLPLTWDDLRRTANETPLPPGSGILVLVTLYGGNDGLSTVIPFTQNAYYDARPDLSYPADDVIRLDSEYGLNPSLKGLGKSFDDGSLAIVRGVGYPDQDRSHFRSMDIWQTGTTDNGTTTGWVGRWLDMGARDPLRAINVGNVLPVLAIGSKTTAATLSPSELARSADHTELLTAFSETGADEPAGFGVVRDSYRDAARASSSFNNVFGDTDDSSSPNSSTDGDSLSSQFDVVARCIRGGLPTQVYCVSISGFDTHSDEKPLQQKLLRRIDESLSRFLKDMSTDERGKNVVVMAYSEFGRRVAANASDGTDHGTSGPVLIAGAPVKGGFYGDDPSLTDLDRGDLKTTTDFRDIYAELLGTTLGTDPDPIVGAKRKPLGFLA
jgi:uncharacterized protein (DUF1501 family)